MVIKLSRYAEAVKGSGFQGTCRTDLPRSEEGRREIWICLQMGRRKCMLSFWKEWFPSCR